MLFTTTILIGATVGLLILLMIANHLSTIAFRLTRISDNLNDTNIAAHGRHHDLLPHLENLVIETKAARVQLNKDMARLFKAQYPSQEPAATAHVVEPTA